MDREEIKQNLKNSNAWIRVLFMILFAVFYTVAISVNWAIVIFQIIYRLITGNISDRVLHFSKGLTLYLYEILQFMAQVSDKKPFPFEEWPLPDDSRDIQKR